MDHILIGAAQPQTPGQLVGSLVFWVIIFALYFAPALVASRRRVQQENAIFVVNLAFGWTVVGWLIALIWATASPSLKGTTTCPFCAERIKAQAVVCPHCRNDLKPGADDSRRRSSVPAHSRGRLNA